MSSSWSVTSAFAPAGDQPKAIGALLRGLEEGQADQVLLGVTGSGKLLQWLRSLLKRNVRP